MLEINKQTIRKKAKLKKLMEMNSIRTAETRVIKKKQQRQQHEYKGIGKWKTFNLNIKSRTPICTYTYIKSSESS